MFASFLWLVALVSSPGAACVSGIPYAELEPAHGLIFEGTVTYIPGEVELQSTVMAQGTVNFKGLRVWLKVDRVWKGEPGSDVEIVYTHHAQQIHGRFHVGDTFIVWAYKRHDRWMTNDCAPTIERSRADAPLLSFLEGLRR